MADIFVSYARADRQIARHLISVLEAQGFSVWSDNELGAAAPYAAHVMREIDSARAVVVLWTPDSIRSDWVRAEAGRALADGKLLPVKLANLHHSAIPLPFANLHTETFTDDVDGQRRLVDAVQSLLSKPSRRPPAATLAIRNGVLSWIGIVGAVLSIVSSLDRVLTLSDWSAWMITSWRSSTLSVWEQASQFVGLPISPYLAFCLTCSAFIAAIAVGARVSVLLGDDLARLHFESEYKGRSWRESLLLLLFIGVFVALPTLNAPLQSHVDYIVGTVVTSGSFIFGEFLAGHAFIKRAWKVLAFAVLMLAFSTLSMFGFRQYLSAGYCVLVTPGNRSRWTLGTATTSSR